MISKMIDKLLTLTLCELNKTLIHSKTWVDNSVFLLLNMLIFLFTKKFGPDVMSQSFFLSISISSILLGVVLISGHIFDDDINDGSLNQYITFGVAPYIIYLSKVIAAFIELGVITALSLPIAGLFFSIDFILIWYIWVVVVLSAPILVSVSVFGSMLIAHLHKNSIINIVLIFPLLISALIIINFALVSINEQNSFLSALPYLEINIGLSLVIVPLLCWLSKYLR